MMRIVTLCLLSLSLFYTPNAVADITRGCEASVTVIVPRKASGIEAVSLGSIEARGGCKNKIHANDCRRAARKELDKCRDAQWAARHSNGIVQECRSLVDGSSRNGAKLTWNGIMIMPEPNRLTARMAQVACCQIRKDADKLRVQIEGRITGDKGCGATKIGKDRYQSEYAYPKYDMDCSNWRAKGVCG